MKVYTRVSAKADKIRRYGYWIADIYILIALIFEWLPRILSKMPFTCIIRKRTFFQKRLNVIQNWKIYLKI